MRYRPLGNTGLSVSAVGLGGVPLSVPETRPDEATAIQVIHHAVDQGVTFIDTADSYGRGESDMGHNERLFRIALAQLSRRRARAVGGGHQGRSHAPRRRLGSKRPPGVPAWAVRGFPAQPRRRADRPPAAPPARSRGADRREHRRVCPPARSRQGALHRGQRVLGRATRRGPVRDRDRQHPEPVLAGAPATRAGTAPWPLPRRGDWHSSPGAHWAASLPRRMGRAILLDGTLRLRGWPSVMA